MDSRLNDASWKKPFLKSLDPKPTDKPTGGHRSAQPAGQMSGNRVRFDETVQFAKFNKNADDERSLQYSKPEPKALRGRSTAQPAAPAGVANEPKASQPGAQDWATAVRHHQSGQMTAILKATREDAAGQPLPADQARQNAATLARDVLKEGSTHDLTLLLRLQAKQDPQFLGQTVTLTVGAGKKAEPVTDTVQNHLLAAVVRSRKPEQFEAVLQGIQEAHYASKSKRQKLTSGLKNLAHKINYQAGQLRNAMVDKKLLPASTSKANLDPQRMSPAVAQVLYRTNDNGNNFWLSLAAEQKSAGADMVRKLANLGVSRDEAAYCLLGFGDMEAAVDLMPELAFDEHALAALKMVANYKMPPLQQSTAMAVLMEAVSTEALEKLPIEEKNAFFKIVLDSASPDFKGLEKLLVAGASVETRSKYGKSVRDFLLGKISSKGPEADLEARLLFLGFLKQNKYIKRGDIQKLDDFASFLSPSNYSPKETKSNLALIDAALEGELIDTEQATWQEPLLALYAKNAFYRYDAERESLDTRRAQYEGVREHYEQGGGVKPKGNLDSTQGAYLGLQASLSLALEQKEKLDSWIEAAGGGKLTCTTNMLGALARRDQQAFTFALQDMARNGVGIDASLLNVIQRQCRENPDDATLQAMKAKLEEY
jgi:hypothetical protein